MCFGVFNGQLKTPKQKCEQTPNFSVFNTLEPLLVNIKYHSVFMLSLIETPNEIY